jgi:hypothetical protein
MDTFMMDTFMIFMVISFAAGSISSRSAAGLDLSRLPRCPREMGADMPRAARAKAKGLSFRFDLWWSRYEIYARKAFTALKLGVRHAFLGDFKGNKMRGRTNLDEEGGRNSEEGDTSEEITERWHQADAAARTPVPVKVDMGRFDRAIARGGGGFGGGPPAQAFLLDDDQGEPEEAGGFLELDSTSADTSHRGGPALLSSGCSCEEGGCRRHASG